MKIAANGIQIHVEEQGDGDVPLVFLHYWGGSHKTWRHVIEALSGDHRTIATDHRGWGLSDAPVSGYGLSDLAADAESVIDALNLKDYVLVGHSMGGKVAQLMASRRPVGLKGLVLVAPSPPPSMVLPPEVVEAMSGAYLTVESVGATIDHVLTGRALAADDRSQVIDDSLRGAPQAKEAWPRATILEDIVAQVTAIDVPTLVIAGELDKVDSVEMLKTHLLPHIPNVQMQVIADTGHLSPLESPIEVAKLIGEFVHDRIKR